MNTLAAKKPKEITTRISYISALIWAGTGVILVVGSAFTTTPLFKHSPLVPFYAVLGFAWCFFNARKRMQRALDEMEAHLFMKIDNITILWFGLLLIAYAVFAKLNEWLGFAENFADIVGQNWAPLSLFVIIITQSIIGLILFKNTTADTN
ncbi:MAG: hypothetical protein JW763_01920 [candidate division Zixibacteria bacterium]|nr:hypothetical protein [candidate division Zixibacteria bacterium]